MSVLAHENVSQIFTTLQEYGVTYLVMEMIGGGELFDTVYLHVRTCQAFAISGAKRHAQGSAMRHLAWYAALAVHP